MYKLQSPYEDPIDEKWYRRLKQIMLVVGETFEILMPPAERLEADYQRFLSSGHVSVPRLRPELPEKELLVRYQADLSQLKNEVADEKLGPVRKLYMARIDETVLNTRLVLAAAEGNDAEFTEANKKIYYGPDKVIFAAGCAWIRNEAAKTKDSNPNCKKSCDDVLRLVPDVDGDVSILAPEERTFQQVKHLHTQPEGYLEQLFDGTSVWNESNYTAANGDAVVRQVIKNVGSDFDLQKSVHGLWSVLQSSSTVVRPPSFSLDKNAFMGIVAHEVGSHLLESTNGSKSKLRLLETGLDRYEAGNEGRAFLREQIMYDSFDEYIFQPEWYPSKASWEYRVAIHLVISLATGLYEDRRYGFQELYELVAVLFRFWTESRGIGMNENLISRGAWNMVIRALKGTDGTGGAYLKDIVYLEGNIRCWQVAKDCPEMIMYGDTGKFDIANHEHVMMLGELGILPA